jgi:predicted aspartyl protease
LHALIFEFLNYASGKLDPALESIARKAGASVASVKRGLRNLKHCGVLNWIRRAAETRDEHGRFCLECGTANLVLPAGLTPQSALVLTGPGIVVDIGFDQAILAQVAAGAPVQPSAAGALPNTQQVLALIDTGATQSCIDEALAQQLQLPLINRQTAAGVGGSHILNVYLAYIVIPLLGTVQAGTFLDAQLTAGGQLHRALIGRTLLSDTLLVYDGRSGSVKLAR